MVPPPVVPPPAAPADVDEALPEPVISEFEPTVEPPPQVDHEPPPATITAFDRVEPPPEPEIPAPVPVVEPEPAPPPPPAITAPPPMLPARDEAPEPAPVEPDPSLPGLPPPPSLAPVAPEEPVSHEEPVSLEERLVQEELRREEPAEEELVVEDEYDDDVLPGFGDDEPAYDEDDMDAFIPPRPVEPDDLGEWLFDKSMEINEAMDIPEAARMSLQILLDFVACDAGCVLYGDYNASDLEFIAAAGPTAHKLRGVRVDINHSLAGFCHRMGFGMLVSEPKSSKHFDRSVDEHTGYNTETMLAVPLRSTEGESYGCLELLNAYWGFEEWMIDASQNIATTLAGYISARL